MPGEDGLDQLAVHAIVVDNQNFNHTLASQAEMRSASRLAGCQNLQIQPNTGDAG
jgi:hypothetical protein